VAAPPAPAQAHARSLPIFPNVTQLPRRISVRTWRRIRVAVLLAGLAEIALLVVRPGLGLDLFYGVAVPALPALWLVAPGIWRNICPLAAANQTPRLFGFTRGASAPAWVGEHGFLIAIALFFGLASSRKWLFGDSGPATAALLGTAMAAAFVGGVVLKGKSGWCSTMCPLLPVQRLYGQNALVVSPNSHCEPCLGCTKNCVDFNPHVAYLADQYDEDRTYQMRRRLFAAALPGFVAGFYLVPDPPAVGIPAMYAALGLFVIASVGLFSLADSTLRLRPGRLTTVAAAIAFALYYWFTIAATAARFDVDVPALVWGLRAVVLVVVAVWTVRTFAKEGAFVEAVVASRGSARAGSGIARAREAARSRPSGGGSGAAEGEVAFSHPDSADVTRVVAPVGSSLLELAEARGLPIEAGCRLGVCGADPVAVLSGMAHLSEVGGDEAATLDRLGLADTTRMACVARVLGGGCEVSLVPEPGGVGAAGPPPFVVDEAVRHVVVIGTGIAGVTAADYVRRYAPDVRIALVGREPHLLYNRMGISRIVYGRSAMSGLFLQDERWYDDRELSRWLNTAAVRIDRERQVVVLGTGEALPYDRLVLATGSASTVPDVPGIDGPGSFVLRDADDAIRIRAWAQREGCSHAVVAGGGLLGLEAAYALSKIGLHVAVLERGDHLLRRQLDGASAAMLRGFLANLGIEVLTGADLREVLRDGADMLLQLADGRRLPCDLLLVAAGITPTTDLAVRAGLEVRRGIVVDDGMHTSDATILAAGDCTEHRGAVVGLWPPAAKQAEVAARNALGDVMAYEPSPPVTLLKVVGVDLASMGRVVAGDGDREVVVADEAQGAYRKLVVDAAGRAVGAILLGHPQLAPAVTRAVERGADVGPLLDRLAAGDWSGLAATS
jgi:nitrite reductase (NADH) large subunit